MVEKLEEQMTIKKKKVAELQSKYKIRVKGEVSTPRKHPRPAWCFAIWGARRRVRSRRIVSVRPLEVPELGGGGRFDEPD